MPERPPSVGGKPVRILRVVELVVHNREAESIRANTKRTDVASVANEVLHTNGKREQVCIRRQELCHIVPAITIGQCKVKRRRPLGGVALERHIARKRNGTGGPEETTPLPQPVPAT